jgi:hypothetical protein
MWLLRATGVHAEAQLPFAALHQLVLPVLDGADRLPDRQRLALLTTVGRTVAFPKPDRMPLACYSVVFVYNHRCLVCHGMSISAEVLV